MPAFLVCYHNFILIHWSYTIANKVGTKGQIVIDKRIRDSLGIGPGWIALQTLVDDYVEIYFVGPEHNRSLMGSLKKFVDPELVRGLSWAEIRELAWSRAVMERYLPETEPVDEVS